MKRSLALLLTLALYSCATTEQATAFGQKAKPFADVATGIVAAYFGLPPGSATVINATRDNLWGMAVKKFAQQPAAQGAVTPDLGAKLAAALPQSATDNGQALILQTAAQSFPTK